MPRLVPALALALLLAAAPVQDAAVEAELVRSYFRACDHDGDGWISFREARDGLGAERADYAVFDTDRDGRVTFEEFAVRYRNVVDRGGAFPQPKPPPRALAPVRTPAQILAAYDLDSSGALQPAELGQMLRDYDREELVLEVVFGKLDRDGSGALLGDELEELARIVASLHAAEGGAATPSDAPKPQSVEELFGRRRGAAGAPGPRGPLPSFQRLDFDGDGLLTPEDLRRLHAPLSLPRGASAALAAIDRDQDGRVSPAEFLAGLGERPSTR